MSAKGEENMRKLGSGEPVLAGKFVNVNVNVNGGEDKVKR